MVWIRLAWGRYQWRTDETQKSTSGFHKMRAVCGLSKELLDSQEVLCPPWSWRSERQRSWKTTEEASVSLLYIHPKFVVFFFVVLSESDV